MKNPKRTMTLAFFLLVMGASLMAGTRVRGLVQSSSPARSGALTKEFDRPDHGETGAASTLSNELPTPFPTEPPDASRISVSAPDVEGVATVSAAAGTVPAQAAVALINLSSRNVAVTTAGEDGAFTASVFAPPGSSLLVKYGDGERVARFWQDAQLARQPDLSYMNPLPGTILPVQPLDRADGEFHSAGFFGEGEGGQWSGWWMEGVMGGADGPGDFQAQPGETVTVTGTLTVTSPAYGCSGTPSLNPIAHFSLHYLFKEDGRAQPWRIWFFSNLFTPTGLPIEHEAEGQSLPLLSADVTALTCSGPHTASGYFDVIFDVPNDLPDGIYLPQAWIDHGGLPLDNNTPRTNIWYHWNPEASLPPLTVGAPVAPRIPWVLAGDHLSNGQRGAIAREDNQRFAMPNRVVFPSRTTILPMRDARTGQLITYRLEPGSPWLSSTDRRMPCPPHVPLAYPAGELTAEIRKPDGSTETIGPTPIRQPSVRTPTTPGGAPIDEGTGHIGDLYHLYTGDDAFAYQFEQYGNHTIILEGFVQDIYGNVYPLSGTYDIFVARILDLDPAQLPTTPYEDGDAFAPGLHIFPPVPAEVEVRLVQMPASDPDQAMETTISGRANRFGYFQPPAGTEVRLEAAGEFRVDINAFYEDPQGTVWAGTLTWGNVVEGPDAQIEAHGRRGMDYETQVGETIDDMPFWFKVFDLPPPKLGIENYYPYFSGDIHWGNEDRAPGDSIHSIITVRDKGGLDGPIYNLLRAHYPRATTAFRWPPNDTSLSGLEQRLQINEAPLFITTQSGIDAEVQPADIDLWGYWYGSSQRPDVHVREIISEDNMGTAYWRFNDTYGYQIGESAEGDLPGDLKWEFGGAVLRAPGAGVAEYAIYSSLWVLLPHGCDAYGCARVTPPFQDATGASINGGPIMTLQGEEIDMLFLPKGIRPGDVLEVGDVVAFSGHVGPPLDSRVEVAITAPGGQTHSRSWHANKIGWLYDPSFDFVADEPGRWTVDVFVEHDRPYVGNGVTPTSHNTGTVLGSGGRYEFYVVEAGSPRLFLSAPQPGFLAWPTDHIEPVQIRGHASAGTSSIYYTIHDKGVVIKQDSVTPDANGSFTITYDAVSLQADFPFISLTAHEGQWEGLADEVSINLLAVGGSQFQAGTVTLISEEVFVHAAPHAIRLPVIVRP